MCDQAQESIHHVLLGCVVAREVWDWVLHQWDKAQWLPTADTDLLLRWTSRPCRKAYQRDLWTAIILVFWCLWRHRNDVVFNGVLPRAETIKTRIRFQAVAAS